MQYPEGITAVRPDEQQSIVALLHVRQSFLHVARALYFVAIHFEDDVSLLQSSIARRAARLHLLDHRSVDLARCLKLIAHFGRKVAEANAPVHFALALGRIITALGRMAAERLQGDRNAHALAFTQNVEHDLRAGLFLSDQHLQLASVAYLLTIDLGNDITDLQTSLRSRRVGLDLRDHSANRGLLVEELGVLGRHVRDSDPDVAVAHFAVADQGLYRGPDDLRWNRKPHSREASRRRDQEGVDADDLAPSIDERPPGVAGVDGRIRLDELAGLAGIGRIRVRPIDRAHDSSRDREAHPIRVAEGQHGLTRPDFFRVAPGSAGEIGGVYFQHRQVSQRIRAHKLRLQNAPVAGGHTNTNYSP